MRQAGSAVINRDFVGARLVPQEIHSLLQLYTAGTITQRTLLEELSKGEVLDDLDVEEELEATQSGGLMETPEPEPTPEPEEAEMPEPEETEEESEGAE